MLRKFIRVGAPYWRSEERFKGFALLAASLLFAVGYVYCLYLVTTWNQLFYDAIQKADLVLFTEAIKRFVFIVAGIVGISAGRFYFSQLLALNWRQWLTTHAVDRWFQEGNYYFCNLLAKKADGSIRR